MDDKQAYQIVKQAWKELHGREGTPAELVLAQAIQRFETAYGRAGQFAAMAAQGKYNWGALERGRNSDGSCPAGTEPGIDAGNARCFFVYPSDVSAAKASLYVLTKADGAHANRTRATLAALGSGDPYAVAKAMRTSPAYYEGFGSTEAEKVHAYGSAIEKNAEVIQASLGIPSLSSPVSSLRKAVGVLLLLAGVGVVGYAWSGPKVLKYFAKF